MMRLSRRSFLGLVGLSATSAIIASPFKKLYSQSVSESSVRVNKFGFLQKDPNGILELPEGFQYQVISQVGDTMDDGFSVPNNHDGMAAFPGKNGTIILVRNHELDSVTTRNNLPSDFPQYDPNSPGGTTTVIVDNQGNLQKHYRSLAGTNRNCSGGATPWGSWISCEEDVATPYPPPGYSLEQVLPYWGRASVKHGYNFEVPITGKLVTPKPLTAMGRFRHEAIAFCPQTGYIYQTEDQNNGCFYRFRPRERENLSAGGILEVMVIKNMPKVDTGLDFPIGQPQAVEWIKLEDVDPKHDTLRYEAQAKGAAIFRRGEGICYANKELYWTCTNGGKAQVGQIFRYNLAQATVELFLESPGAEVLDYPDNLVMSPFGDLIVCEDGKGEQFLIGITPEGKYYQFARNALNNSEFAGVCFAPDGKTMFVNIYRPGLTLAISGNW